MVTMVTNLLNMGTDDTIGNCTEMREPCPSGFDDASHLLIRGNFTGPLKSQFTSCEGSVSSREPHFVVRVLSGMMRVSIEMYR